MQPSHMGWRALTTPARSILKPLPGRCTSDMEVCYQCTSKVRTRVPEKEVVRGTTSAGLEGGSRQVVIEAGMLQPAAVTMQLL